jgi:hypothetical protein
MSRALLFALLLTVSDNRAKQPGCFARTCNIPVFRYALERWPAAPYDVIAVHRGPLSEAQSAALNVLRQAGANVELDRLDLSEPLPPKRARLLERLKVEAPALLALYPETDVEAWRGPLSVDAARALTDSPVRREVARRLLAGQSGVWILLESGDKGKDDAAEAFLKKELQALEQSLKLPAHHADDPPLLSDVPLKIAFSILRLSRADAAEQPLVSMLEKSEKGLQGTVAFPIFGRGRVLWGLAGRGMTADNITESGVFLTGACSCEAKELNPGVDLLFAADWESGLSAAPEAPKVPEPILKPRPPEPSEPPPARAQETGPLWWIALLVAGLLIAISGNRIRAALKAERAGSGG